MTGTVFTDTLNDEQKRALVQASRGPAPGPWGVWHRHEQRWVVEDQPDPRGAYQELLAVDTLQPWELAVAYRRADGTPDLSSLTVSSAGKEKPCPEHWCDEGACDSCGRTCGTCDGSGTVRT